MIDSSGVVDYLVGGETDGAVADLIASEQELAAPDLVVFEVLAALRRMAFAGVVAHDRATDAVADLADVPISLFACKPLRQRAWELRHNFTVADALFVALAERLSEPLATVDRRLAGTIAERPDVDVEVLALLPS